MWEGDFYLNVGNRPSLRRLAELGPKYILTLGWTWADQAS